MFNFEGRNECINIFNGVWEDFRQQVSNVEYTTEELERAKEHVFLKTLDDVLHYEDNMERLAVSFATLRLNYIFSRATKLTEEESKSHIDLSRFLPMDKFIEDDNRFSPKRVEYLYLGSKFNIYSTKNYRNIEKLCLKEIRSEKGNIVGHCRFEIREYLYGKHVANTDYKVIDLSLWDNYSFEEIQNELSTMDFTDDNLKSNLNKLLFKLYIRLLSSELFKPVENVDGEKRYTPFHYLAYYFKSLGFQSIIYKSTVHQSDDVRNIVLFEKNFAVPTEYKIEVIR